MKVESEYMMFFYLMYQIKDAFNVYDEVHC